MVQYDPYGFEQLRLYAKNNFLWLAIIDDGGAEVARIDLSSDARATLTSDETSNPLTWEVTFTGSDSEITPPVTLDQYELYLTSGASTALGGDSLRDASGTATTATLEADADTVTITVDQEIPPI